MSYLAAKFRGHKSADVTLTWSRTLFALVFIACATTCCGSATETVWSANVPSPDGEWSARGATENTSGPGNNYTSISVHLKTRDDAGPGQLVLLYAQNAIPWRENTPPLAMKWLSPTHLQITFDQVPTFDAQVNSYAGIEISVAKGHVSAQ